MPRHEPTSYQPINRYRGGGRVASDPFRFAQSLGDHFAGLGEGVNRYDLLLLVKRAGKLAGFTPRMICLLDYYFAFTRESDWEEGARPIVYQSLSRTALDLGVSERQIQKLEAALFAAGAISWNDSGNHRRYGRRCSETGRLDYAFGVDLTPLAFLRNDLVAKLDEKRLHDETWRETKRQISWHRRQVRGLLLEAEQRRFCWLADSVQSYDEIAVPIRTSLKLPKLRCLLERHQSLHNDLLARMAQATAEAKRGPQSLPTAQEPSKGSSKSEEKDAHYQATNQEPSDKSESSRGDIGFQGGVAEPIVPIDPARSAGLHHVSLGMALDAASVRFTSYAGGEVTWRGLVEAAGRLRPQHGISQASWAEACDLLGRNGAALCLLVTDQATYRLENRVERPAAYFRGLLRRARGGELRLHKTIFGLLEGDLACH